MSPDLALFILAGDGEEEDDVFFTVVITGQRDGERERERESDGASTVPLTRYHLYCQGSSARLAAA